MTSGRPAALLALATLLAGSAPARAGRLDLDVYAAPPLESEGAATGGSTSLEGLAELVAPRPRLPSRSGSRRSLGELWRPGDPRDLHGQPVWVQYASHAAYTGLGVAGLVTSLASGGVAPAVGFGIVTLVQAFRGWRLHQELSGRHAPPSGK